jgi:two-component system CheB/CheR fusion protein
MKKQTTPKIASATRLPVVAIGAAAGGKEAALELFGHLAKPTGMCYIYLQTGAAAASELSAAIASKATMPVHEVQENTKLKPNTIYLVSPEQHPVVEKGILKIEPDKSAVTFPIDQFFSFLVEDQKQPAIGIILSGASTDGTLGLKAIRAAGGITMTQDQSALFQNMAQSAISEDVADLILSPKQMAKELERISEKNDFFFADTADDLHELADEESITDIIKYLKKTVGVDFSHYKRNTITRRIVRRMLLYKLDTPKDYYDYIRKQVNEVTALYKDLLINVTCFFRDTDTIEFLKKTILPQLIKSKGGDPLRIWIPACSTGEEAYSIAMIIFELLGTRAANTPVQIFATDLSDNAIGKARLGLYSKNDLSEVSSKRIQRFFTKVDGSYRIIKAIRDLCIFSPHNVFKDPPFSRMDIISCCNLFIYLEPTLQKKIIATFHYALNPSGYLVLGKSEALGGSAQLFAQIEKKYKVYIRKEASSKAIFDMSYRLPDTGAKLPVVKKQTASADAEKLETFEKTVDTILLSRFVPPSIIVNHELEILQFRGSTGLFLEPSSGKASFNLLKMARQGLAFELRNIIHKANKTQQPSQKTGLKLKHNGTFHQVSIEAIPLKNNNEERLFLIVFQETEQTDAETKVSYSKDKLVNKLQDELETLREDMRAIVEDQEVSNEELQSANEEILSSNEELQSINEELETSKEEVESSNEELMTINQELHIRNEQLAESYEYAEAVFTTIRESVILLDKDLRIKNANRAFYNTFYHKEQEIEDYLLFEIANGQWKIPALEKAISQILSGEVSQVQGLEVKHHFSQAGEKFMLVNIRRIIQKSHRKEVILIAIEDITEHHNGLKIIEERETWFRNMADSAPVMIWVANTEKQITFFNKTWFDFTGTTPETKNKWPEAVHDEDRELFLNAFNENFNQEKAFAMEYRIKDAAGMYHWMLCDAKPTYTHDNLFSGYIGTVANIQDQKTVSEELEWRVKARTKELIEANKNLERSNSELQQFAYVASHDLQEPLRKILTFSHRLQTKFRSTVAGDAADYISKIAESSQRMTDLITDLLNFSKVTNPNEHFESVNLGEVVNDVLKNLDLAINDKNIDLKKEGKLPTIMAVSVQMNQLFQNLIANAIKFSTAKNSAITISSAELPAKELKERGLNKNRKYYKISIKDNGIGFHQEYAEQIFIIFQRLNDKRLFPGTGIGLALCRKIVHYHEGMIYAESEKGKGACFHIILPVQVEK